MISTTITWMFFVFLNAYYGGAMTMFVSSDITVPFETLSDVMEAYPDWKLKTQKGKEIWFKGSLVPAVSSISIVLEIFSKLK